jgi:ATP-binding cassette, subfamily F, member 3
MIQIRNLHYAIGERRLLDGVEWMIHPGRHMALIGPNGAGKTTLLKILHGDLRPDLGDMVMPRGTRIGYLPQEEVTLEKGSLLETVLKSQKELIRLESQIKTIHLQLEEETDPDQSLLSQLGHLEDHFTALGGYEAEHSAKRILTGLRFQESDFDRPISEFSGGWRMRAVLAGLLLQDPDILLLDEPTNHLDLPSLEWLEQYLLTFRGSIVIVSHDRFFIDRLVTEIAELDMGRLTQYTGNYHQYEKQKAEAAELLKKRWKEQQDELKRQQVFIDRFRSKATKAAQVQSRIKLLEKVERIELPDERAAWSFRIAVRKPSFKDVLHISRMSFAYDRDWVLDRIDLSVFRGEKIAMVGENGAGKTTLTRLIYGDLTPQQGSVTLGQHVGIGYYSQHQIDALDLNKTVMEEVSTFSSDATPQRIRNVLGIFQFSGDDVFKKIMVLSGGEKARVSLAKMLLSEANFLIMDEPTNHLDIVSKETLEQALQEYDGTLLLISHDRYFLTKLVHRVIEVADGKIRTYEGNYNDYLEKRIREGTGPENGDSRMDGAESPKKSPAAGNKSRERRRSEAEARDAFNRLKKPVETRIRKTEAEVEAWESRKRELETRMADPKTYSQGPLIGQLQRDYAESEKELKRLYADWEKGHAELEGLIKTHGTPRREET